MDRETLVLRNKGMTEAFHRLPLKHVLRRVLLRTAANIPVMRTAENRKNANTILMIRPDHLGDVLLTTPALSLLRAAQPSADIHMLVGDWSADVLAAYDDMDTILTLPFPGFARGTTHSALSPYQLALKSARKLRAINYRAALIMRPDHWWGALVAQLAGIPIRIGYDHPDVAPFLTQTVALQHEHTVIQNARLVAALTQQEIDPANLPLQFRVNEADRGQIDDELYARTINDDKPIFAIHPGAGTWVKRWDIEKWAAVADTLAGRLDATPIFTGGDHERELIASIQSHMRISAINFAGETDIGTLAALYQRAQIVLGADSGPMHLAVAVGTPTVTLFGAADPVAFGSWGDTLKHPMLFSDIGCRPCRVLDWGADDPAYHPCVRDITVARVLDTAARALASRE